MMHEQYLGHNALFILAAYLLTTIIIVILGAWVIITGLCVRRSLKKIGQQFCQSCVEE